MYVVAVQCSVVIGNANAFPPAMTPSRQPAPQLLRLQSSGIEVNHHQSPSSSSQPNSGFGQGMRSPRPPQLPSHEQPRREPVPRFTVLHGDNDLDPKINSQPPFRRANPEGGFISVSGGPASIRQRVANPWPIALASSNNSPAFDLSHL